MDSASYKRNVFKTLALKEAKAGVRTLARKTQTINTAHGIVGFRTEVGELLEEVSQYLLGNQLSSEMKARSQKEFGDALYYLTVVAKSVKAKMPGSGKKIKLHGLTRSEALLKLDHISNEMLDAFKKAFYGRDIDMERVKLLTEQAIELMWPLHYDMFQVAPGETMAKNIAHLAAKYPAGTFDAEKEAEYDKANDEAKVVPA